jgi:hypothetical protein
MSIILEKALTTTSSNICPQFFLPSPEDATAGEEHPLVYANSTLPMECMYQGEVQKRIHECSHGIYCVGTLWRRSKLGIRT